MWQWLQRLPPKLKGSSQLYLHEKDSLQEKVKGIHETSQSDILQSHGLFFSHKYHSLFLWKEQAARSSPTAAEAAPALLTPVAAPALLCGHTAGCADR